MRGLYILIGLAAAAAPRIVDACSFPCGLSIERPLDDEPHPANAALHIVACPEYAETLLSITVDGAPASLVPAVASPYSSDGRMSISPTPAPGQEIVIEMCGEEAATFGCPDPAEPIEVLRYVAGPDDLEAPPAAGIVTLAHTYGETEVSCMDIGDVEFHVDITDLDQGAETAVLYVVELDNGPPEGSSRPRRVEWVGPAAVSSLSIDIGDHLESITIPPDDACVTVTAMDLAGNVTDIATTCGSTATNAPPQAGDSSSGGGAESGDSSTTADDPPIDATSSTSTSGEPADTGDVDAAADETDRGCACAASRGSMSGLFTLLVIASFRRRRSTPRR